MVFAGLVAWLLATSGHAATWLINEDYKQPDARGASDFEILFQGNIAGQITGGGMSSVTNPFADPTRTTSQDAFGNTIVRFSGSNTIPQNATTDRHFGIYGDSAKPRVLIKTWSFATAPFRVPVPKSNFAFSYFPATQDLRITVENTSPYTVRFAEVGFQLTPNEVPIDQLTRPNLPPSAFQPIPALNGVYQPGQFASFLVQDVPPTYYALTYGTVAFVDAPEVSNYDATGGEWAAVLVSANPIPEPGSALLVLAGLLGLALLCWRRQAGWMLALPFALAPVGSALGDAWVLPLQTPAYDDMPTVSIGATVGGAQVNIGNVVIDTGGGMAEGLYLNSASATALGMNTAAGTASSSSGVGGSTTTTAGVPTPAGLAPSGSSGAIPPGGQAAQNPTLPGTATVGPLPAGVNGLIGSTFLSAYNYGRIDGYFFLALKTQGAAGLSTATAIASFLGLGAPFVAGSDGKPAGSKNNIVVPTPVQSPTQQDQGFVLPTDLRNAQGNASLQDQPFTIRTGLPTTLISLQLAQALELQLTGAPLVETLGDFGAIEVLSVPLDLRLFDDASFPSFNVTVGVLSPGDNPFGLNFLGGDVLGQLPYWEISQDAAGMTRFYAASSLEPVPEPSTGLVLSLGLAALAGLHWRRRVVRRRLLR